MWSQVGVAPKVEEFSRLVQYSHINHLWKYPVNATFYPLHCSNSADKQGSTTWCSKNVFTFSIVTPSHLHFPLGPWKYFRKCPYELHFKCKDIQAHLRTVITVYRHTGIPAYLWFSQHSHKLVKKGWLLQRTIPSRPNRMELGLIGPIESLWW